MTAKDVRPLLDRLSRLVASEDWSNGLNPAQMAALDYLGRANRFSRAPSHLAEYLQATRGTVSQTLIALERKGLVRSRPSEKDKRSLDYELTEAGRDRLAGSRQDRVDDALSEAERAQLAGLLSKILTTALAARGYRRFGLCRTCGHHQPRPDGGYCALLAVSLAAGEEQQICHEHVD